MDQLSIATIVSNESQDIAQSFENHTWTNILLVRDWNSGICAYEGVVLTTILQCLVILYIRFAR